MNARHTERTGSPRTRSTLTMDDLFEWEAQLPLPPSLQLERHGPVAVLRLSRAAKRNALDDATVLGMEAFFSAPPAEVAAVVLDAEGEHFSAGLDLSELTERDAFGGLEHSMMWHRV